MLVGDLVYNDNFDCNCNYEIYDCTEEGKQWGDGAEVIFSTKTDRFKKPLDAILDMKIKYITTNENAIIIEAARQIRNFKSTFTERKVNVMNLTKYITDETIIEAIKNEYLLEDIDGYADELCNYLSDEYEYCIEGFNVECR